MQKETKSLMEELKQKLEEVHTLSKDIAKRTGNELEDEKKRFFLDATQPVFEIFEQLDYKDKRRLIMELQNTFGDKNV